MGSALGWMSADMLPIMLWCRDIASGTHFLAAGDDVLALLEPLHAGVD
jgi:hypothetical protein